MTLSRRLTLAIFAVLSLFSINVATYFWGSHARSENMETLERSIEGQQTINRVKRLLDDQRKAILVLATVREATDHVLSEEDRQRAFAELTQLEQALRELDALTFRVDGFNGDHPALRANQLTALWLRLIEHFNDTHYNHSANINSAEMIYLEINQLLRELTNALVESSDAQSNAIATTVALTDRITIVVFLASIFVTSSLGLFLIRHTNYSLFRLREGTVRIGRGDLHHRIPHLGNDELGQLATAFNEMSDRLYHAMAQVNRAREQADEANRAKTTFLASMSHELRTPLNAIIGYSEMLQEEIEDDAFDAQTAQADLEKIRSAGRQLLSLISEVLDLSKIETGKMVLHVERFNPATVIHDVVATISPLAEQRHNRLQVELAEPLPEIDNDLQKFRHTLFNLLSNACKFTESGVIKISCRFLPAPRPRLRLIVSDTGIGMTTEQCDRIFDPFVQAEHSTERRYGGTGLGLALCRQYSELMGGNIQVESEPGHGSVFTVTIPQSVQPSATTPQPLPGPHAQVLVIDDDPLALTVMEKQLTRDGIAVQCADNAELGLQLAREHQPQLIILDLIMPGMDGWTTLSLLREERTTRHIPVLLQSMLSPEELGLDEESSTYLQKPIGWPFLREMIQRLTPVPALGTVILLESKSAQRDFFGNALTAAGWQVLSSDQTERAQEWLESRQIDLLLCALPSIPHEVERWLLQWQQRQPRPQLIRVHEEISEPHMPRWCDQLLYRPGLHVEEALKTLSALNYPGSAPADA